MRFLLNKLPIVDYGQFFNSKIITSRQTDRQTDRLADRFSEIRGDTKSLKREGERSSEGNLEERKEK